MRRRYYVREPHGPHQGAAVVDRANGHARIAWCGDLLSGTRKTARQIARLLNEHENAKATGGGR